MTNSDYCAHSALLFAQLKLLDIFKVNTLQIAKFIFLYHHRLLPVSLSNLFLTKNQVYRYETRNANFYRPHVCRTNIKQFTILYQGPKICNSLPDSIKCDGRFYLFNLLNKVICIFHIPA